MKRFISIALGTCVFAAPLYAALQPGATAPDFTTQATLAGKPFKFALADALKKGPVVLYFYPAAFTPGCTVEAHEFAEATDKFKSMGATVIGVSHDDIDKLNKFLGANAATNSRWPRTRTRASPKPTTPSWRRSLNTPIVRRM